MAIIVTSTPDTPVAAPAASTDVKDAEKQSAPVAQEAAEQKPAEASETSETEASDSEEESEGDSGDELDASDGDSEKDKPKKKSGSQRRKERAERAEAEVARLQRIVEEMALKGAGDSNKRDQTEPQPQQSASQDGEPDPESFNTHKEYVRALARWEAEQILKDRDQKAEQAKLEAERQKIVDSHKERVKSYAATKSDWDEVIESVADTRVSATVQEILLTSENGPELMYELAKSGELERISKLGPIAAAREMGKIEVRLASKASETKKPEQTKTTKAPAPITPVGTKGGNVEKSINDPNLSQREYEAVRRKQMAARTSSW
jgi:hypothetical protein